ncbi:hypothetical protein CDAR_216511 [Caerostris darwini]|uniref:Uncharacterized protein n=1 Tax=Caerostris darwini TaxID=1538125 RepID=A0AAV4W9A5_9ARAC|nr:hypothetical protein CDAR_216511 [Caerostris darwini]
MIGWSDGGEKYEREPTSLTLLCLNSCRFLTAPFKPPSYRFLCRTRGRVGIHLNPLSPPFAGGTSGHVAQPVFVLPASYFQRPPSPTEQMKRDGRGNCRLAAPLPNRIPPSPSRSCEGGWFMVGVARMECVLWGGMERGEVRIGVRPHERIYVAMRC